VARSDFFSISFKIDGVPNSFRSPFFSVPGNNRIQIFSPDGIFVKAIGSWGVGDQEFKGLEGLACANGNIFAVDRVNHSVSVI